MPAGKRRLELLCIVLLAVFGLAERASANAANPFIQRPGAAAGVYVLGQTPLRVERERLSFRCRGEGSSADCRFEARYEVHNPTAEAVIALGAFYGYGIPDLRVTMNGHDARTPLLPEQIEAIDARVRSLDPQREGASYGEPEGPESVGYAIEVRAGDTVTLIFEGPIEPVTLRQSAGSYFMPAAAARHIFASNDAREGTSTAYRYLIAPIRDWAGVPDIEVSIEHDDGLELTYEGIGGATTEAGDGTTIVRGTIDSRRASELRFGFEEGGTQVFTGGPLVGIGARLDESAVRLRAGWEIGAPSMLVHSLAIETDFDTNVTFVLGTELATPMIVFIPSIAIGAGVPLSISKTRDPLLGVRLSFAVSLPILTLYIPLDWYPARNGDVFESALLAQFSI